MAWFSKQKKMKTKESTPAAPPPPAAKGEGIWYKCDACEGVVARATFVPVGDTNGLRYSAELEP